MSGQLRRWRCWRWWLASTSSQPRSYGGTAVADRLQGLRRRVISAGELNAAHRKSRRPLGRVRAHLAAEPQTGIIDDEELTKAAGSRLRRRGCRADDRRETEPAKVAATPPSAPGTCAPPSLKAAHCGHQAEAAQARRGGRFTWTTSPPASRPALSPARTASPAASLPAATSPSAPPAATACCVPAARPASTAGSISHNDDSLLRAAAATGAPAQPCQRPTATGRTWNARSPRLLLRGRRSSSATAAPPATTLAQAPHCRLEPAQLHQPRPGPAERSMGTRRRRPAARGCLRPRR